MKSLTRMVVAAGISVAGAGVVGAGCVSSETTPPQGSMYPTELAFCERLAELVCNDQVVRGCYGSDDSSLVADREACATAFQQTDTCRPDLEYHPDPNDRNATACLSAWRDAYADAALTAAEIAAAEEACMAAFHDGGVENQDCVEDWECDIADGLRCVIKPGDTSGTCQVPTEVGAGFPCEAIDERCEEGFYCDVGANACLARKNVGESCSSEILCVEDATCSAPVDGTCEAKLPNNTECEQDEECANGLCNKGTGDTFGLCSGTITLNQTAAACDDFR